MELPSLKILVALSTKCKLSYEHKNVVLTHAKDEERKQHKNNQEPLHLLHTSSIFYSYRESGIRRDEYDVSICPSCGHGHGYTISCNKSSFDL